MNLDTYIPDKLTLTRKEVRQALVELKNDLQKKFQNSIQEVKDCYPEDIFPTHSRSNDCKYAKAARETCDKIKGVYENKREKKAEIMIVPKTKLPAIDAMPEVFIWEQYRGWTGTILKDSKNGNEDAFEVRITNGNARFIVTSINKSDIEIL